VFLEQVLDEVLELFPFKYIHIGGDECPKARWEQCSKCQHRIQEVGTGGRQEGKGAGEKKRGMHNGLDGGRRRGKSKVGMGEKEEGWGLKERDWARTLLVGLKGYLGVSA
jgi:hypothetical protein